ncbi:MAG TPA: winged helix-turn-helix transcriptional regulator [Blastocatellia bacterium]|nr:winged helix-turn-helix transcriptional regulator [Blastocatellia bacterium]
MTESVFACKWSARILGLIRDGVNRPGAITHELDGLTTKVLNDCLRRLLGFGLLERTSYPEIPPRVEYRLTRLGERFVLILDAVDELQLELDGRDRNREASIKRGESDEDCTAGY